MAKLKTEGLIFQVKPVKTIKLSLIQRLWLLLLILVGLSIGGALISNLLNARRYLEQQLTFQSINTANSLALMLTQNKADPAAAQLLLNATYEQGYFSGVRWETPRGRAQIDLQHAETENGVPQWFRRMLPLEPQPGVALVNRDWQQAGRIVVIAQRGVAYQSLWRGALQTVSWLLIIGLAAALLGAIQIRALRRQLSIVVVQAHAISEQRFMQIPIPELPELAKVAGAMNLMVDRLQQVLGALHDEVNLLHQQTLTDCSTGVPNREAFDRAFCQLLQPREDAVCGYLLLIRLAGLSELNQRQGGHMTDVLIGRVADDLLARSRTRPGWMVTRLRGADFALLCPELPGDQARLLADEICASWPLYQEMGLTDQSGVGHIGVAPFQTGDSLEQVVSRAGQALVLAEAQESNTWVMDAQAGERALPSSDLDWRQMIGQVCRDGTLQMRWFPVCSADGEVVWHEGMLFRSQIGSAPHMGALRLVSHALRVGLIHQLDLTALTLALHEGPAGRLAVNLSPVSLAHPEFLPRVLSALQTVPSRRINFEFLESGLEEQWSAFVAFGAAVCPAGHQLAVEIKGHNLQLVARVHEAGQAYLVVDRALTQGVHADEGRMALMRGLLQMASLMGDRLEVKGIDNRDDLLTLTEIGVHYLTGPAVNDDLAHVG